MCIYLKISWCDIPQTSYIILANIIFLLSAVCHCMVNAVSYCLFAAVKFLFLRPPMLIHCYHYCWHAIYSCFGLCTNFIYLHFYREEANKWFFRAMSQPSSCIFSLLPPPRDGTITSRIRPASIYPPPVTRTKRFTSSVQYCLLKLPYQ